MSRLTTQMTFTIAGLRGPGGAVTADLAALEANVIGKSGEAAASAAAAEAAAEEVGNTVGRRHIPGVSFAIPDPRGFRGWLEMNDRNGGPTPHSMNLLREEMPLPYFRNIPGVAFAIPDPRGFRGWLEMNDMDGGPTPRSIELWNKALSGVSTLAIACYGDSMTDGGFGHAGSWAANLAALTGRSVQKLGVRGSTAVEICIRAGGVVPLLTIPGGQLPANTTPVAVTTSITAPLSPLGQPARTYDVTIRGVPATLTYSPGTSDPPVAPSWAIARKAAGTAVLINPTEPIPAVPITPYQRNINILWAGRNDTPKSGAYASIEATITRFEKIGAPFLVVGVMNTGDEIIGTSGYNNVLALDAQIRARAPRNYVDMRGRMIREGLALAGITPTTADTTAIANDTFPPSLQYDGDGYKLHLNQAGDAAAALIIQDELKQRGFIA